MPRITIHHRFENTPQWECKALILGTFNPVNPHIHCTVHYGRSTAHGQFSNRFYPALATLRPDLPVPSPLVHESMVAHLKHHGIGCLDIVRSVTVDAEIEDLVTARGFADRHVFAGDFEKNFEDILDWVEQPHPSGKGRVGDGLKVISSSWGQGTSLPRLARFMLEEFNNEVAERFPHIELQLFGALPPFGRPLMTDAELGQRLQQVLHL